MKKLIASILAMATLAACAVSVAGCKEESNVQAGVGQTQVGGMQVSEGKGNGIALLSATLPTSEYETYGVSPLADSAYTINATVSPSYTTNAVVNWTISWANDSSEWASGKNVTDYVTISPSGDYFHTAVVSCSQAFGEQIKIRATADSNSSAYAECTVDYAIRVINGMISMGNYLSPDFLCFFTADRAEINDKHGDDTMSTVLPDNSDYTVQDNFTSSCTYTYSSEFIAAVSAKTGLYADNGYSFKKTSWDLTTEKMPCSVWAMVTDSLDSSAASAVFIMNFWAAAQSKFYEVFQEQPEIVIGYIDVSYVGTYSSFSNRIPVYAGDDVVEQEASSVSLDNTSVVF